MLVLERLGALQIPELSTEKNELQTEDIDIVNRWRSVEAAKGKGPNLPMKRHYDDIQILLEPFLRYTKAM